MTNNNLVYNQAFAMGSKKKYMKFLKTQYFFSLNNLKERFEMFYITSLLCTVKVSYVKLWEI